MPFNTKSIKKDLDDRPIPQFFNSAADDYEALQGTTGATRTILCGPDGNPISSTNGALDVALTGRNATDEIIFIDAVEVRDTNGVVAPTPIDLSAYARVRFIIINTLDQDVTVDWRFESGTTSRVWDGTDWVRPAITVPNLGNDHRFIAGTQLELFRHALVRGMRVVAICSVAPTLGSLTVKAYVSIN